MPSSNLYSHPGRLLEDHLLGVARFFDFFLSEKPESIKYQLANVGRVISLSHDLGKATQYFQTYLQADEKDKSRLKNFPNTRHSLFSAICAFYLSRELKETNDLLPLAAFITVHRHHGNLIDIYDELSPYDDTAKNILSEQLESINQDSFSILTKKAYESGLPSLLDKQTISSWINDFPNELKIIKRSLRHRHFEIDDYLFLNLLYSLLLDADKSDAVFQDLQFFQRRAALPSNLVDNFKRQAKFDTSPINHLRDRAYREVVERDIDLTKRIYSINLPTGLGKTLTSLSFALKLKEKAGSTHRIIYALPFLSIIDQNSLVFDCVLKANGIKTQSNILLKHHHLSDIYYYQDDNEFEPDEAKILIEGWNAEIIVTTFAQLFHSLITNSNRSLRKFHRLANSILILDEVQSVPIRYWELLNAVLNDLARYFHSYIVLVTATEPLLFKPDEVVRLANRDFYFKSLDRISIQSKIDKNITLKDLTESWAFDDGRSYLIILNTISAAREFYNLVKHLNIPTTYLSTHLVPKERINRIKDMRAGKYKLVVSTQLVEAGVDIDFDVVIRDLAPLDSINQAAGRCNRNGMAKGTVYIYSLENDQKKPYASYIYDPVLLYITRNILEQHPTINESELLTVIDEYYQECRKRKSQEMARAIKEALTKLRYDSQDDKVSISNFRLIEEDYPKIDVFVEVDEYAHQIWQRYTNLVKIKDLFERKKSFDLMKADFYQYIISIPSNAKNRPPKVGDMGYVELSAIHDFYDDMTGFIPKDERSVLIS